jgi:hypothetical protein
MYETLLLAAFEGIVGSKEIGNENALVCAKQVLQKTALPRILKEIANLARASKNPNITDGLPQFHGCFVNAKNIRINDICEYFLAQRIIVRSQDRFELVRARTANA